jgi:hypothetical protein
MRGAKVILLVLALTGCATDRQVAPATKAIEPPPLLESQKQSLIEEAKSISVMFPAPWTENEITVFEAVGAPIRVKASQTMAKVKRGGMTQDWPQLAFVCPRTGNTWIGPQYPFYVETPTGLYGLVLTDRLEWHESGVVKEYSFKMPLFDDLMLRYRAEPAHFFTYSDRPSFYYDLRLLGRDFFAGQLGKACLVMPKAALSVGVLELELENTCRNRRATLWIDVQARELLRCVRDGRQLFP